MIFPKILTRSYNGPVLLNFVSCLSSAFRVAAFRYHPFQFCSFFSKAFVQITDFSSCFVIYRKFFALLTEVRISSIQDVVVYNTTVSMHALNFHSWLFLYYMNCWVKRCNITFAMQSYNSFLIAFQNETTDVALLLYIPDCGTILHWFWLLQTAVSQIISVLIL